MHTALLVRTREWLDSKHHHMPGHAGFYFECEGEWGGGGWRESARACWA